MAILDITEYATISALPNHTGQIPFELAIAYQQLPIGGSVNSVAFQPLTRMVRLHCDTPCRFVFSYAVAPIAAASIHPRMAGNQTEFHGVAEGGQMIVSVVATT